MGTGESLVILEPFFLSGLHRTLEEKNPGIVLNKSIGQSHELLLMGPPNMTSPFGSRDGCPSLVSDLDGLNLSSPGRLKGSNCPQ